MYVTVSHGMRGWYAALCDVDGFPVSTGIGSYETPEAAHEEAREWALAERVRLAPLTKAAA